MWDPVSLVRWQVGENFFLSLFFLPKFENSQELSPEIAVNRCYVSGNVVTDLSFSFHTKVTAWRQVHQFFVHKLPIRRYSIFAPPRFALLPFF